MKHIRERYWPLTPHDRFDLPGVLFEDDEVEMLEGNERAQLIGKASGQLLRLATGRKRRADANHRLIAWAFASVRNRHSCAHLCYNLRFSGSLLQGALMIHLGLDRGIVITIMPLYGLMLTLDGQFRPSTPWR